MKKVGGWLTAGAVMLLLAGCVKAPVEEQQAAQDAKNAAIGVQAETFALQTLNAAQAKLDEAENQMKNKAYQEAKETYLAAKAAFEQAGVEVEVGKQAMIVENQKALQILETGWMGLRAMAKTRIKKVGADAKADWDRDSKVIIEAVAKGKDVAVNPSDVKNLLAKANSLVEKWLVELQRKK